MLKRVGDFPGMRRWRRVRISRSGVEKEDDEVSRLSLCETHPNRIRPRLPVARCENEEVLTIQLEPRNLVRLEPQRLEHALLLVLAEDGR